MNTMCLLFIFRIKDELMMFTLSSSFFLRFSIQGFTSPSVSNSRQLFVVDHHHHFFLSFSLSLLSLSLSVLSRYYVGVCKVRNDGTRKDELGRKDDDHHHRSGKGGEQERKSEGSEVLCDCSSFFPSFFSSFVLGKYQSRYRFFLRSCLLFSLSFCPRRTFFPSNFSLSLFFPSDLVLRKQTEREREKKERKKRSRKLYL